MIQNLFRGLTALLVLLSVSLGGLVASGAVTSSGDTPCEAGDSRATCVDDNFGDLSVAVCTENFSVPGGETMLWIGSADSSGNSDSYISVSSRGSFLFVAVTPPAVLVGTAVKGGDAYNLWPGYVRSYLHAPLNDGGQVPEISHWTACYYIPEVPPTTVPTTTTPCDPYVCEKQAD